jgi:hypothetical protein
VWPRAHIRLQFRTPFPLPPSSFPERRTPWEAITYLPFSRTLPKTNASQETPCPTLASPHDGPQTGTQVLNRSEVQFALDRRDLIGLPVSSGGSCSQRSSSSLLSSLFGRGRVFRPLAIARRAMGSGVGFVPAACRS